MKSTAGKNIIKIVNQLIVPENLQQVSYWKINSTLFNNPRIKQDSRGIKKKHTEWHKSENTTSNFVGHS